MEILIDSDIIIDFLSNQNSAVVFFRESISNKKIYISVISWAEVVYGFKKIKTINKIQLFQNFLDDYQIKVISIDEKVAEKYLEIKIDLEVRRIPLDDFDLLIAATATSYSLSLMTRNIKHFKRVKGLILYE
ncbi:hypothetical protein CO051_05490 [Candidatus Roizmanbacteria bacterium CG_4_9_14_0_2_um_filter_39_13]|uniref:PIN domain-containing protein n=2 Tax=Candidatus Roizmaniibacteriota TaxID=1752723 RepID=A0A2M8EX79_9BACT|nr:MAG: hypothetical protein CO051_05490 [Candidatus Roizmanbacteria bacterium CG_4_9_14_0_2_um_filter_39_13]PJE61494.1 MAG: hypothetical protein COU87_04360 [Candidatus Roizmanbacteria bacterium CG10_big_fil_rev_8_21_14_0_10_39_12]